MAGLPHSAEGAAKIGADGLKPLNVIHRWRDSSQKKIGAVPTTSNTDPLSLTPSLIPSVDEVSSGAPMRHRSADAGEGVEHQPLPG